MDKKTIMGALIIILALFGIMWWGGKNTPAKGIDNESGKGSVSQLNVSEISHDFGTISMAKGNVSKTFKVENKSAEDVKIGKLYTSCMCTNAYIIGGTEKRGPFGMPGHGAVPSANELIKAGESREIEVVYDPAAHGPAGVVPVERSVYIEDSKGGSIELRISAVVTP